MSSRIREFREQSQVQDAEMPVSPPATTQPRKSNDDRALGLVVAFSPDTPPQADVPADDGRMVDRRTQAAIGQQLRSMYNDVATAPVPDRLLALLDELEKKSSDSTSGEGQS